MMKRGAVTGRDERERGNERILKQGGRRDEARLEEERDVHCHCAMERAGTEEKIRRDREREGRTGKEQKRKVESFFSRKMKRRSLE